MSSNLWLVVVGMAVVTYIPRMLPLVFLDAKKLPPFFITFFQFIPCAAISALIFPGFLTSTSSVESAVSGGLVSVILALFKLNVIIVVFGGILGVFVWDVVIVG